MAYFGNESKVFIKKQAHENNAVVTTYKTFVNPISADQRLVFNSGIINENVSFIERDVVTGDRQYISQDVFRDRSSFSGSFSVPLTDPNATNNLAFKTLLESAMGNVDIFTVTASPDKKYYTLSNSNDVLGKSSGGAQTEGTPRFSGFSIGIELPGAHTSAQSHRQITGALVNSMSYSLNVSGITNVEFGIIANSMSYPSGGEAIAKSNVALPSLHRTGGYKSSISINDASTVDSTLFGNSLYTQSGTDDFNFTTATPTNSNTTLQVTDFSFNLENGIELLDMVEGTDNQGVPYYSSPRRITGSLSVLWNDAAKLLAGRILGSSPNADIKRASIIHTVNVSTSTTIDFVFPSVHFDQGGLQDLSPDQLTATFNFVAYQTSSGMNNEFFIQSE